MSPSRLDRRPRAGARRRGRGGVPGGRVAAALVLVVGVGWPAVALVRRALSPLAGRRGLSIDTFDRVLGSARTWRVVGGTVAQATASTAVAGVLGVALAVLVARGGVAGGRRAVDVAMAAFLVPTLAMGSAVRELAGWIGPLGADRWAQIVVAHVLFNVGFVAAAVLPAVEAVSGRVDAAARVLGRSRRGAWATAARAVAPSMAQAWGVVFVLCVTSFGVVLALGGGSVTTVEVEIWFQATRLVDLPAASVLSVVQVVVVLVALSVVTRAGGRAGAPVVPSRGRSPVRVGPTVLAWAAVATLVGLPVAALVSAATRDPGGRTLDHVTALGREVAGLGTTPLAALSRSTGLAVAVGATAVVVALVLAGGGGGGWVRRAAVVPMAASAATLGLAWLVAWSSRPDLRGTWWIVAGVQAAAVTPVALAVIGPGLDRVDTRTRDAAAVLGAGPRRRAREVWWPAVEPTIVVALGLAAAAALGEIGATSVVATSRLATAPMVVQQLLARPGAASAGRAAALGLALVVVAVAMVAVSGAVGRRAPRSPNRRAPAR